MALRRFMSQQTLDEILDSMTPGDPEEKFLSGTRKRYIARKKQAIESLITERETAARIDEFERNKNAYLTSDDEGWSRYLEDRIAALQQPTKEAE